MGACQLLRSTCGGPAAAEHFWRVSVPSYDPLAEANEVCWGKSAVARGLAWADHRGAAGPEMTEGIESWALDLVWDGLDGELGAAGTTGLIYILKDCFPHSVGN